MKHLCEYPDCKEKADNKWLIITKEGEWIAKFCNIHINAVYRVESKRDGWIDCRVVKIYDTLTV